MRVIRSRLLGATLADPTNFTGRGWRTSFWWHVTPGVPHWHGATPNGPFAHLAVTAGGGTRWLDEVVDADFLAAPFTR